MFVIVGTAAAALWLPLAAQDKPAPVPAPLPAVSAPKIGLMPADFLDNVGQQTKARWRQLYREAPPAPSANRFRAAFTLGGIITDSYLALQAGDAQQFRNTNQDILNYAKLLGLGEKISPNLLVGAKMAEREDWPAVRKQIADAQQIVEKLLLDQKDEDLATLVDLGVWMRLFQITTSVIAETDDFPNKTLCVGSVPLLVDLKARYDKLAEPARADDTGTRLGTVLDVLVRHWESTEGHPSGETVQFTMEKLHYLMDRVTMKEE